MRKMIPYKRHDLVWLSDAGKDYALRNIQSCVPPVSDREKNDLIFSSVPIPAIVRRQETAEGGPLCVGFSSPRIIDGMRLRIGSRVPLDYITERKTPFDVAKYEKSHLPHCEILQALIDAGKERNVEVGCFGSIAMQIVTKLVYCQEKSDLDIYLRLHGSRQDMEQFFSQLLEFERQFGVTTDPEIEFGDYGVKLKEIFTPGKTMLGKGLYDVTLLDKSSFWPVQNP